MEGGFDIERLQQEAHHRWLKPSEIYFILLNHEKYSISQELVNRPPSGSLLLFNRRVHRFFRKDGHMWRKKRDGKTISEAHERLKVGTVDALNCYYAHGEQNSYFQRRSYWMLEPVYEHIVLVHYREVSEGRCSLGATVPPSSLSNHNNPIRCGTTGMQGINSGSNEVNLPHSTTLHDPGYVEEVSSKLFMEVNSTDCLRLGDREGNSTISSQIEVNSALRRLEAQLSLDDDDDDTCNSQRPQGSDVVNHENGHSHVTLESIGQGSEQQEIDYEFQAPDDSMEQQTHLFMRQDCMTRRGSTAVWKDMLGPFNNSGVQKSGTNSRTTMLHVHRDFASTYLPQTGDVADINYFENGLPSLETGFVLPSDSLDRLEQQCSETRNLVSGSYEYVEAPAISADANTNGDLEHRLSGVRARASRVLDNQNDACLIGDFTYVNGKASSCENSGEWSDEKHYAPSLGAKSGLASVDKQRFHIREVSPEWAFSSQNTKVIITGDFLCDPSECSWSVMFDNIEVPVEIVQDGVLRCWSPKHVPGNVRCCITSGNKKPCSEIWEFQYLAKLQASNSGRKSTQINGTRNTDELLLLLRFAKVLLCGSDDSAHQKTAIPDSEIDPLGKLKGSDDEWDQIIEAILEGSENQSDTIDWLLQEFLKDKLQSWLLSKIQKDESTACSLSKQELCVLHMVSGLGYEWALNPLLNSGVGINFRDVNGWTALHWAARFGREKMVAALLAAGASAGAVTDPTSQDPVGKTPASVSSTFGHKGLAGYLSEVALTSHLSSLMIGESEISGVSSAGVETERVVESISERTKQVSCDETEEQLSLRDSLAAVRNAAQAAARIQAAFRAHSFLKRQRWAAAASSNYNEYELNLEDIRCLSAASRTQRGSHSHVDENLHGAALSIQKKFRGWTGRRSFLTLRRNAVKIQAHVRGHQVRGKYKDVLWTVGILEKVILRWRRKGVGLRGFRAEPEHMDKIDEEEEDILKVFRKKKVDEAVEEAVSRVLSVVESFNARLQYRRMLDRYHKAKAELSSASEATSSTPSDMEGEDEMLELVLKSWYNNEQVK